MQDGEFRAERGGVLGCHVRSFVSANINGRANELAGFGLGGQVRRRTPVLSRTTSSGSTTRRVPLLGNRPGGSLDPVQEQPERAPPHLAEVLPDGRQRGGK